MDEINPDFDDYTETHHHLELGNKSTQTIDLQGLVTSDVSQSGFFDLSDIGSTSLGKLLDALPVPVLLIDKWFCISFANQAWETLNADYKGTRGSRFTDLLLYSGEAARSDTLITKTMSLLERVFIDKKPQRAEAILEIGKQRIWARLNLRSVRLGADRHIMCITEDVTSERTQWHMLQRDGKELRKETRRIGRPCSGSHRETHRSETGGAMGNGST